MCYSVIFVAILSSHCILKQKRMVCMLALPSANTRDSLIFNIVYSNVKVRSSLRSSQVAHQAGAYPGFRSMK